MNGWEDYFRDGKFGKTNLFFVGMFCSSARITVLWMERKQCLRYQHFVGWQQISLIIESKTLYDCKRLHAAQKECVGSQCIFWVLEEEFWCLTRTDFRTLCGVDRLCMLHTDIMSSQHRRQFWGLQTEISCLTNTDFSILYGGLKLCVQHRHHCTSLAARNWCWGSLGSLENSSFFPVWELQKPPQHALKALNGSRGCLKQIFGISDESPRRLW